MPKCFFLSHKFSVVLVGRKSDRGYVCGLMPANGYLASFVCQTPPPPKNACEAPNLPPKVYIRSAWRVSDSEIRLTLVSVVKAKFEFSDLIWVCRRVVFRRTIRFRFGETSGNLNIDCNRPTCVEDYSPVRLLID